MTKPFETDVEVAWYLLMNTGNIVHDMAPANGSVSSWRVLQNNVSEEYFPMSIGLFKSSNGKNIELGHGQHNFFFSKRTGYVLGQSQIPEQYGIGFTNKREDNTMCATITWYDNELNPVETEERDIEKCLDILIPKITTASLSQN